MSMILTKLLTIFALSTALHASAPVDGHFYVGRVESVSIEDAKDPTIEQSDAVITVFVDELQDSITIYQPFTAWQQHLYYKEGESVIIHALTQIDGEVLYYIYDRYRLPATVSTVVLFFIVAFIIGGIVALRSLGGLCVSIGILLLIVLPVVTAGYNPFIVAMLATLVITVVGMGISHGFNRRTTVAIISTLITLCISIILAWLSVMLLRLFGVGSEEAVFLQQSNEVVVDVRGLLLAGVIIGALGVLDDITSAQTATIDELSRANAKLSAKQLFFAGYSVGKEHIASLINTLALAYFGSALPMFLLISIDRVTPLWVLLSTEFVTEEFMRTLIGSSALLFAVPISTAIAAHTFAYGKCSHVHGRHSHGHTH
jgi:uncharacterized membrane protein